MPLVSTPWPVNGPFQSPPDFSNVALAGRQVTVTLSAAGGVYGYFVVDGDTSANLIEHPAALGNTTTFDFAVPDGV